MKIDEKKVPEKPRFWSQIARVVSQIVDIVSQVVEKLKDEPFLFVIAIVALLIGLALLSINLGSPNTRFIVAIIAILTFSVILRHFVIDIIQIRERQIGYIDLWKCSKCGHMNRWENWYCNNCKQKWEESKDTHMWLCKKCDEHNLWDNDFCTKCGKHYMMSPAAFNPEPFE